MFARSIVPFIMTPLLLISCATWKAGPVSADQTRQALQALERDAEISTVILNAAESTLANHPEANITTDQMWATVIDYTDPMHPRIGSMRGDELVYPASVIKVCYLVHAYQRRLEGTIDWDRDLVAAIDRMIRVSSNVATQYVVDRLSGVRDCPRFEDPALTAYWIAQREQTNEYFRSLGFNGFNANQKTWDELPDENSMELFFLGGPHAMGYENGNRMTTDDTAALMWLIATNQIVGEGACEEMRELLARRGEEGSETSYQIGRGVPEGTLVWAKDGSTGRFRHDAAFIILPDGRRLAMALFTDMPFRQGLRRDPVIAEWCSGIIEALD